jgi:hypothetical protein
VLVQQAQHWELVRLQQAFAPGWALVLGLVLAEAGRSAGFARVPAHWASY